MGTLSKLVKSGIKTSIKIVAAPVYVPVKTLEIICEAKFMPKIETSIHDSGLDSDSDSQNSGEN